VSALGFSPLGGFVSVVLHNQCALSVIVPLNSELWSDHTGFVICALPLYSDTCGFSTISRAIMWGWGPNGIISLCE